MIELATGDSGSAIPAASLAYLGLGDIYYEWNDLDSAEDHYAEAIAIAKRGNRMGDVAYGLVASAMTRSAMGYEDDPSDVIRAANRLIHEHGLSSTAYAVKVASTQARLMMARNDLDAASKCLAKQNISIDDEFSPRVELVYLTLAWSLIERARSDSSLAQISAALQLLGDILENAEVSGRIASTVEALSLEALAYGADGKNQKAIVLLDNAVSLAQPEGYIRTFVDRGQPMADLLKLLSGKSDQPEYVDKLVLAFNVNSPPIVQPVETEQATLLEPLSDRELEVLGLLVKGKSNRLIASELFVSVNTVKTHLKNVYEKLGVHGRTQAVLRSSELDLF